MNNINLNYKTYCILGRMSDIKYKDIHYLDCGEITFFNLFNYLLLNNDDTFNLTKLDKDSDIYKFYYKYLRFEVLSTNFKTDEDEIKNNFYKNITDKSNILYKKNICEITSA